MKTRVVATLSALALAAALAPLPTLAASGDVTSYDLSTRQLDSMAAGEFDGRLQLQVRPDGIVGGTFRDSEGHLSFVTGGLNGDKIWLRLGDRGRPFNGTLDDGKLVVSAQGYGFHTLTLEGTRFKHY